VASAAAGLLIFLGVFRQSNAQIADQLVAESNALSLLDETTLAEPAVEYDVDELAQELQYHDTFLLAEATPSDDQWIEESLKLLDQLDQESVLDDAEPLSNDEDDWLEELRQLDESELSSPT
jgi:hypothetical protein